jgi:hypothetical protein
VPFDFPSNPTPGQVFIAGGAGYTWNGYAWLLGGTHGALIADTAPVSPSPGQLWWESDTGALYIYYNDGNSQAWVQINGAVAASGGAAAPTAPVNTVAPVITGKAVQGQTLTVSRGTWTNSPASYAYQWFRATTAIPGATTTAYVPQTVDVGAVLHAKVTATNVGSGTAQSNDTGVIAAAPLMFADFINGVFWYDGVFYATWAEWLTATGSNYPGPTPIFAAGGIGLHLNAANVLTLGPTGMWPKWNPSAGTLLWEGTKTDGDTGRMLVDSGSGNIYMIEYYQPDLVGSGAIYASTVTGNRWDSPNGAQAGLTWDAAERRLCMSGGAVTSGSPNLPMTGRMLVGGIPGGAIEGHCRSLTYLPKKVTDAELQALTLGETVWISPPALTGHLLLSGGADD